MIQSHHILIFSAVIMLNACNSADQASDNAGDGYSVEWLTDHIDYGEKIHEKGRACLWESDRMELGLSRFTAAVGPNVYQDEDNREPDFYSIDVEFGHEDGSAVLFQRDLHISDLPDNFASLKASDVVKFDPRSRRVDFSIGDNKFSYTIPESRIANKP